MATIQIDKNLMVPMRDGVRLATDVYRREGAPPAPVLLTRTPYDREHTLVAGVGVAFDVFRAVQSGYAVVIQDVRGRFASEGDFTPHFQEARDGADTIAWAAEQPWSSGVVGGFGGSYLGCTQWLEARERPPALRAMASAVAPSNMDEGMAYQGGAHVFHGRRWAAVMTTEEIRRRAASGAAQTRSMSSYREWATQAAENQQLVEQVLTVWRGYAFGQPAPDVTARSTDDDVEWHVTPPGIWCSAARQPRPSSA